MPTIFPPCPTLQTLGSPTRTELFIINTHRGWCQICSLDMEITAPENNLLFICSSSLLGEGHKVWRRKNLLGLAPATSWPCWHFSGQAVRSRFCILAGIPQVNLPRSAFSSTAPLPAPASECSPSHICTFSILFYADPIFLLIPINPS